MLIIAIHLMLRPLQLRAARDLLSIIPTHLLASVPPSELSTLLYTDRPRLRVRTAADGAVQQSNSDVCFRSLTTGPTVVTSPQ